MLERAPNCGVIVGILVNSILSFADSLANSMVGIGKTLLKMGFKSIDGMEEESQDMNHNKVIGPPSATGSSMHKQLKQKLALLGLKEAWHIQYARQAAVMNALYEAKDERNSSTHCKKSG